MTETPPLPDRILARFQHGGEPMTLNRARRLADEIETYNGLDSAIAALAHDQAFAALGDALAYRALLADADRPEALIERLQRQAADLDARASPAWAEAASLRGRAAYRVRQGEMALAAQMQAQADAAERFAADLEARAFGLRLRAAALQASASVRALLLNLAA
ncbi:MAG TPA: hypothetical protein VMU59_14045 [Caulobacteraceae bacterium]|nr:hypothetical protein [Caulobacteraceae bacterium]